MRKLLITGGAGFIGANFVHYWVQHHPNDKIVVLDALTYAGRRENLANIKSSANFTFVHGNICDANLLVKIFKDHHINTVVHFAAESHVDRSIAGPDVFIETNIVGTHELLKAAKHAWLEDKNFQGPCRFHHVSTDEVYGSLTAADPAFTEITPYAPNSPYAASKAGSDHIVRAYHHTYGLPVTTSNCSNNYGPYQFPEKLIPLLITNALQGKALPIYGDGKNIRDWLYVEDHCRGIELILEKGKVGEVYNIGGNNEQINLDIAHLICQLLDVKIKNNPQLQQSFALSPASKNNTTASLLEFVTDRPGHDRRYAINAAKIQNELGYRPHENFESGFAKTIDWYLQNQDWWLKILNKKTALTA